MPLRNFTKNKASGTSATFKALINFWVRSPPLISAEFCVGASSKLSAISFAQILALLQRQTNRPYRKAAESVGKHELIKSGSGTATRSLQLSPPWPSVNQEFNLGELLTLSPWVEGAA